MLEIRVGLLADIVAAARLDQPVPDGFASDIAAVLEELLLGAGDATAPPATVIADDTDALGERRYRIDFTPHSEMLRKANEPLLLIRRLRRLGGLTMQVDSSRVPLLDAMEPEAAYLSWTFTLDTGAPQSAIHEVFEFVEDDCDLTIQVLPSDAAVAATAGGAARCCRCGEAGGCRCPSGRADPVDSG